MCEESSKGYVENGARTLISINPHYQVNVATHCKLGDQNHMQGYGCMLWGIKFAIIMQHACKWPSFLFYGADIILSRALPYLNSLNEHPDTCLVNDFSARKSRNSTKEHEITSVSHQPNMYRIIVL
jgi:hypothetical protein